MPSNSSVTVGSVTVPTACNPFVTLLLLFFHLLRCTGGLEQVFVSELLTQTYVDALRRYGGVHR
jgi:hypothetical protein